MIQWVCQCQIIRKDAKVNDFNLSNDFSEDISPSLSTSLSSVDITIINLPSHQINLGKSLTLCIQQPQCKNYHVYDKVGRGWHTINFSSWNNYNWFMSKEGLFSKIKHHTLHIDSMSHIKGHWSALQPKGKIKLHVDSINL